MISLKKLIDTPLGTSRPTERSSVDPLQPALTQALIQTKPDASMHAPEPGGLLSAYHAALAAMGIHGQRAVPILDNMIPLALSQITDRLNRSPTPETVRECRHMVEEQLSLWADRAQHNQKESEQTIRDLLMAVFEATESTGKRDEKFSREIAALSGRLRVVAGLDSLPVMRRSINDNATALTDCVVRMADEGRESIRKLTSEIAGYQVRLLASERRALVDPLTGLCNRRGFEQQLDLRIHDRQPFSLLVVDLNGFKTANDRHGHLAGDQILRQFATELKAQFIPEDTVARWGGDEFVAVVGGTEQEGVVRADRVRHWVLGEYKIAIDNRIIPITVDAALGVAAWNGKESGLELFARADREMYRAKEKSRELVRA
jgi:diguanylate cyclase (GGDEF)-like protein